MAQNVNMEHITIVYDNAPVHVDLEHVVQEEEFLSAEILRIANRANTLAPVLQKHIFVFLS